LFLTRGLHFRSESATNIRSKRPVLFLFVDRKTRTSIRLNYILHPVLFYHRRPTVFCSVSLIIHVRRSRCGVDMQGGQCVGAWALLAHWTHSLSDIIHLHRIRL